MTQVLWLRSWLLERYTYWEHYMQAWSSPLSWEGKFMLPYPTGRYWGRLRRRQISGFVANAGPWWGKRDFFGHQPVRDGAHWWVAWALCGSATCSSNNWNIRYYTKGQKSWSNYLRSRLLGQIEQHGLWMSKKLKNDLLDALGESDA